MKSLSGPPSAAACAAMASRASAAAVAATVAASAAASARRRRSTTSRQSADVRALDSRRPLRLPLEPLRRSAGRAPVLRRSVLRWRAPPLERASSSAACPCHITTASVREGSGWRRPLCNCGRPLVDEGKLRIGAALARIAAEAQALTPRLPCLSTMTPHCLEPH